MYQSLRDCTPQQDSWEGRGGEREGRGRGGEGRGREKGERGREGKTLLNFDVHR